MTDRTDEHARRPVVWYLV